MKYIIIGFVLIVVYKITINISALIRLWYYDQKYEAYLLKQNVDFNEYAPAVLKLFKAAGISDASIPFVKPAGYGMLAKGSTSFFANLATTNCDCIAMMKRNLSAARGIFKGRVFEALSPLYWISCVIFLPRSMLGYLGLDTDGIVSKSLQLIYWLVTPFLVFFRDSIYQYITALFS